MKRFLMILLALSVLLACVPTPEEEAVVNKADGRVSEVIAQNGVGFSTDEYRISMPATWTAAPEGHGGTVETVIDARIVFPDVTRIPTLELLPTGITPEAVYAFCEAIAPGSRLMRIPVDEFGMARRTRTQVLAEIEANNDRIEHAAELLPDVEESERIEYRRALEQANAELMQEYASLPEDEAPTPADVAALKADGFQGEVGLFDANGTQIAFLTLIFDSGGAQREQMHMRVADWSKTGTPIEAEDAVAQTLRILEALGCADRYAVESLQEGKTIVTVNCTPTYGGVGYLSGGDNDWTGDYIAFDPEDSFSISFDKTSGVATNASWCGSAKVLREASENTELMPIARIEAQAIKDLDYLHAWENDNVQGRTITVQELRFGYKRVKMPGGKRMLLPAWAVVGAITDRGTTTDLDTGEVNAFNHTTYEGTLLILNALDGSLIGSTTIE